jgi:hypothetical protein
LKNELGPKQKATLAPEPAEVLSPEEIEQREREKREILASLGQPRKPAAKAPEPAQPQPAPAEVKPAAPVVAPEPAPDPSAAATAVMDAATERQRIESDIAALTQQLASARQREAAAKQAAVRAQQAQVQAEGSAALAQYVKRLERHRDEVARVQARFGPILKEAARSMASGPDASLRQAKQEAYKQAGILGARLGDTRAHLEDAIRRVTLDTQSSNPMHHAQARTLADAALSVNVLALETEVASLVQAITELNPTLSPSTTPDHVRPGAYEPRGPIITTVDLGRSII